MFKVGSLLSISRVFSPAQLFANGEQGFWLDPFDMASMFQDSAGTTPVTATGQPVGKMLDKSGRGNHAIQATSASRPVLQKDAAGRFYLAFDGIDDSLSVSINFGIDKITAVAGLRRLLGTPRAILFEHTNASTGRFSIEAPSSGTDRYAAASGGSTVVFTPGSPVYTAPESSVLTLTADISIDDLKLRHNGALDVSQNTDQGTGNFANSTLYIGARAGTSLFFNGNLHGLIVRGAVSETGQIFFAESWMNAKTGAY